MSELDVELRAIAHALVAEAPSPPSMPRLPQQAPRATRPPRHLVLTLAAIAALAVFITALVVADAGDRRPAAAAALESLAQTAETAPMPDGPIIYTRSRNGFRTGSPTGFVPYRFNLEWTRELWVSPKDGSGRLREVYDPPTFPTPDDKQAWIRAGSDPHGESFDELKAPGSLLLPWDVRSLPTDPEDLGARLLDLHAETGRSDTMVLFDQVASILRETGAPPALRAGAFRLAASLAGVTVSQSTDRIGRPGIKVELRTSEFGPLRREVLIFDPQTSALLAEETISDGENGGQWVVWLEQTSVDAIPPSS